MKKITHDLIRMDASRFKEQGFVNTLDLSEKMGVKKTYLRKIINVLIGSGVILEDGTWWGDLPNLHKSWIDVKVILNKQRTNGLSELGKSTAKILQNRWIGKKTINELITMYNLHQRRLYEICLVFQAVGLLYSSKYEFDPSFGAPPSYVIPQSPITPKRRISKRSGVIWGGMKKIKFDLNNTDGLF